MGLHVPRITINFDFKESSSFGELSLISLGYGLHQAWIYSSMFDKGGIFGSNVLQAGPFNDHLSLAYFVSILVYGVLLLVASALDTKLIRFFHSAAALGGAAALGALGTLMLLLPEDSFFTLGMIQALSGILTGAGSSVLLIAWGIMFARQDSASIVINGALSIAIGFAVYGLFLHQIHFPLGGVASALLPVCELALLLVLRTHVSLDFDNRRLAFQPLPINHARFVLRFGLPVFFLGVALGILRQTSIETILPGTGFEDQAILFLTACCAMVLIMVTFLALGGDERWHTFFRPLIPFIAVTAVFIPFAAGDDGIWGTSIVLVGYMTFEALMWIFFAELAQRFRLSPIFVCGLGRGVMALAALGGSTLPLFSEALPLSNAFGEAGVVFVVIIAMMLAYTLLPDEREMASIVTVDPHKAAAVHNISRTPLIVVNEGETLVVGQSLVAAKDAAEGAPGESESTSRDEQSAASPSENSPVEEETSFFEEASPAPATSRPRMDFSRSIFAEEPSEETPLPEESQIERDHFRERCEAVANTYLLSRRENEVMYYLARGYKSSFIQQQLYISEGTAKTHIRHIYRKLDIHSQQELIHLIDEVELQDAQPRQ
ncbi:response regulator transcription factor [uncultured Adlercreutzia sp.]|uniref:response regulator transcription factor n=1 Tax=uncultured Adlercreutzia sp. TaxID=875803 RepID=UPI00272ECC33|nr:LuxR C-terminal-related transcriptional regulator [uncultured Adlercreutzia sp.]